MAFEEILSHRNTIHVNKNGWHLSQEYKTHQAIQTGLTRRRGKSPISNEMSLVLPEIYFEQLGWYPTRQTWDQTSAP